MLNWSQMAVWILGAVLAVSAALTLMAGTGRAQEMGECVHTYRIPGCEGGRECVRREIVPCEVQEPSWGDQAVGAARKAGDAVADALGMPDAEQQRQPGHFGVRN